MGLILTNDNKWMRTVEINSRRDNWYYELMVWCTEHCAGEYTITPNVVAFEKESDAVFFQLVFK